MHEGWWQWRQAHIHYLNTLVPWVFSPQVLGGYTYEKVAPIDHVCEERCMWWTDGAPRGGSNRQRKVCARGLTPRAVPPCHLSGCRGFQRLAFARSLHTSTAPSLLRAPSDVAHQYHCLFAWRGWHWS